MKLRGEGGRRERAYIFRGTSNFFRSPLAEGVFRVLRQKLLKEHLAIERPRSSILPPPVERSPPPRRPQPQLICQRGTAAAAAFTSSAALPLPLRSAVPTAAASKEDDDVSRAVDVAYISRKAGRGENGTLMSAYSAVLDASFDISHSILSRNMLEYRRSGLFLLFKPFATHYTSLYRTQSP